MAFHFNAKKDFQVSSSNGDTDWLTVKTAIMSSKTMKTVLIGSDTDLLCLLMHYSNEIVLSLYLKSEPNNEKMGKFGILKNEKSLGRKCLQIVNICTHHSRLRQDFKKI